MLSVTEWVGVGLLGVALIGSLWVMWTLGTVRQPKKAEMPEQLRDAAEHKRRVELNKQIAMGRVRDEQRRAS